MSNSKDFDGGVSIVNSSGIVVMTIKGNDLSTGIYIGHLPAGLYLVRNFNNTAVAKIIKR